MIESQPTSPPVQAPLDDEFVIDNLETLKVIADPLRKRILELLDKPSTVKQIARQLGMSASKLYYHVNLLEEHGLIRVTETRIVSGIIEKHYQISAWHINVKSGLLSPTAETGDEGLNLILSDMLDSAKEEIRAGVRDGSIEFTDDAPRHRKLFFSQSIAALRPERAEDFYARLRALVEEFSDEDADNDPNARPYRMAMFIFPLPVPSPHPPDDEPA